MRIESTYNPLVGGPATNRATPDQSAAATGAVGDLTQIAQGNAKAQAGDDVNRLAVAEAKRLLLEGQLDTPEAALRAANSMITRGL